MQATFLSESVERARIASAEQSQIPQFFSPDFEVFDLPRCGFLAKISESSQWNFTTFPGVIDWNYCRDIEAITLIDDDTLFCFSEMKTEDVKFILSTAFLPF